MSNDELIETIKTYNQIETEQAKRLEGIFLEMRQRTGYREIVFSSGDKWGPGALDPNIDVKMAVPRIVGDMTRTITSHKLGTG